MRKNVSWDNDLLTIPEELHGNVKIALTSLAKIISEYDMYETRRIEKFREILINFKFLWKNLEDLCKYSPGVNFLDIYLSDFGSLRNFTEEMSKDSILTNTTNIASYFKNLYNNFEESEFALSKMFLEIGELLIINQTIASRLSTHIFKREWHQKYETFTILYEVLVRFMCVCRHFKGDLSFVNQTKKAQVKII